MLTNLCLMSKKKFFFKKLVSRKFPPGKWNATLVALMKIFSENSEFWKSTHNFREFLFHDSNLKTQQFSGNLTKVDRVSVFFPVRLRFAVFLKKMNEETLLHLNSEITSSCSFFSAVFAAKQT